MADKGMQRKLRAVFSADVKGYSKLMGEDDESTVSTITTYREIIAGLIEKHQGRVVDAPGDNILATFSSALNAVNSAVEIQRKLKTENAQLPENRRMEFRIGINLGDILHKEDRIYGDGVNVAARIESLADSGGICVSRGVFDQVKNKVCQGFEYLGEHVVKNISDPVRIYRVLLSPEYDGRVINEPVSKPTFKKSSAAIIGLIVLLIVSLIWFFYPRSVTIEPALVEKMALPLPDKPSIAVIAFENMSGDPAQEYLSDGIAENIITALSNVGELFVISRSSSFTYKGKPVKIQQVSQELGVRYVLEGSVQKSGDKLRITAQLIDAINGRHLWAQNYDRDVKDIFGIQDDITKKIVTSLRLELSEGEQARIFEKQCKTMAGYLKHAQASSLWREGSKESLMRFGQLAQEIKALEPESTAGYRLLGWYHWGLATRGISPQPRKSIEKSHGFALKAVSVDESDSLSHGLLSATYRVMRNYEKAIASGRRAVELDPNGAMVRGLLGQSLYYAGQLDDALVQMKQAIRLNPFPASWYFTTLGLIYRQYGRYEDAIREFNHAIKRSPNNYMNYLGLATTCVFLNRQKEAEAAARKIMELYPDFSIKRFSKSLLYKQAEKEVIIDALRKSGLPD